MLGCTVVAGGVQKVRREVIKCDPYAAVKALLVRAEGGETNQQLKMEGALPPLLF